MSGTEACEVHPCACKNYILKQALVKEDDDGGGGGGFSGILNEIYFYIARVKYNKVTARVLTFSNLKVRMEKD